MVFVKVEAAAVMQRPKTSVTSARLDYDPAALPGVTVGGSAYVGNSGQNQTFCGDKMPMSLRNSMKRMCNGNIVDWNSAPWDHGDISMMLLLSVQTTTLSWRSQNYGFYTELGYDVLPLLWQDTTQYLAPFFRYEKLDTIAKAPNGFADDPTKDWQIYQVGLQYKPIPNVVIKADYRNLRCETRPFAG